MSTSGPITNKNWKSKIPLAQSYQGIDDAVEDMSFIVSFLDALSWWGKGPVVSPACLSILRNTGRGEGTIKPILS